MMRRKKKMELIQELSQIYSAENLTTVHRRLNMKIALGNKKMRYGKKKEKKSLMQEIEFFSRNKKTLFP